MCPDWLKIVFHDSIEHRTSTSCWCNVGTSKENLHFDNQSCSCLFCYKQCFLREIENISLCFYQVIETLAKVWEKLKKLWKQSDMAQVPTAFLILPNFHLCFYNKIIRNTVHVLYFLNNALEARLQAVRYHSFALLHVSTCVQYNLEDFTWTVLWSHLNYAFNQVKVAP